MKLSFKKNEPTGRYRSFNNADHEIKADGKAVGVIVCFRNDSRWHVRLAVEQEPTDSDPAPFRWVQLTKTHSTAEEARAWVREHWDDIQFGFALFNLDR